MKTILNMYLFREFPPVSLHTIAQIGCLFCKAGNLCEVKMFALMHILHIFFRVYLLNNLIYAMFIFVTSIEGH